MGAALGFLGAKLEPATAFLVSVAGAIARLQLGRPDREAAPAAANRWWEWKLPGDSEQGDKDPGRMTAAKIDSPVTDRDTGAALRSVYQKTVDEAIPDEMLDLLGRLD